MKKILVPTDFSSCAKSASKMAIDLANCFGAEVHFLHLIMTPVDWVKLPKEKEANFPEVLAQIGLANSELGELKREAERNGLKAHTYINFDQGREEIIKHTDYFSNDFIVMGSYGAKGFKEIIGSNTQQIVRNSKSTVLMVREDHHLENLNTIVYATDLSNASKEPIQRVYEFASTLKLSVELLYINVPGRFMETKEIEGKYDAFKKYLGIDKIEFKYIDALTTERGISEYVDQKKSSMIAIHTHGSSNLFSSSVTDKLVNHANAPVLCIK